MAMPFGLAGIGDGMAIPTFIRAAIGIMQGQGIPMPAGRGNIPTAATGGTEAIGIKPPNPLKGELFR